MAGVQNSRSKGLYKVGPIGIEKLILHLRYEAGPIGNHAVHKLGASIALAWALVNYDMVNIAQSICRD